MDHRVVVQLQTAVPAFTPTLRVRQLGITVDRGHTIQLYLEKEGFGLGLPSGQERGISVRDSLDPVCWAAL